MPDKLTIYLLGDAQFRLNDAPPLPLEAGKASALLAYLAVEAGRPHARQTLAELLWPERADADALGALRFVLSNLRAVLRDRQTTTPFLLVDRSHVQLNPLAEIWVDAAAFQKQAAACEAVSNQDAAPSLEALRAALALYRGPFLHGYNLGDSLDFESWALRTREQLERHHLRLLRLLGAAQEAAGDYAPAVETYRAILAVQPWDEEIHCCVMRALTASGEPGAALAQYAACRQALRELGIEPGRAATALYQHIKQTSGVADVGYEPAGVPFVARERELAQLTHALERMLAGRGQVVLLTGEAGSGKTALLNAFARQALARRPDLLVTGGQCDAYTGVGQPYQPFIESVQALAGECEMLSCAGLLLPEAQARLRQTLIPIAQTLVEAAPTLLGRVVNRTALAQRVQAQDEMPGPAAAWQKMLAHPAADGALPESLNTGRLFEEVTRFFVTLARHRPLVLLLDDLQWIDTGSAALLFHLTRRLAHSRLLLLAAYRPGEIGHRGETGQHPLLGIVTEMQRYGGDIRVDLDQVDEQAFVTAFLAQDPLLYPNRLDATFGAALARRTGGNPLFTIELLRSLQARNEIRRAADGSWVSNPTLEWEHVPERVEAAIAGRIAHLPAAWRDWLATASVEGESFTAEAVARVQGIDTAALLRDLSGPLGMGRGARRLVQGEGARAAGGDQARRLSRYRFRHILFQAYLYQQLDPVERARRHAAVGAALEALYEGLPEERARRAADLARHFEIGGLPEKAAAYHLEAGRQAVYLAAPPAAVTHYRRGLALLADVPRSPARDRLEIHLHLALGAPFLSTSGWGGAERQAAIQQALALLEETGQTYSGQVRPEPGEWDDLLLAFYEQADWLLSQGEFLPAAQLGEHLLALAGEQVSVAHVLAHRILGYSFLFQGNFPGARQHLENALAAYHTIGRPDTLPWIGGDLELMCRSVLGFTLAVSGYLDQAWVQISQALARARRIKHMSALGSTLIFACEVAVLRGDMDALRALAGELLRVGETEGLQFFLAYGWAAEGYAQAAQTPPGTPQAAANLELIRRGMRMWESTATYTGRGMWIVRLAAACLQAEDITAGLAITSAILATPDQPGITIGLAQIYRLHGELLLRQEIPDRSAAEAFFHQATEIARQQEAHTLELRAALSLAKLWHAEKPEAARCLLAETCAWFTEGWDTHDWQEAQALLQSNL
jgi:DNA-binding SARP family transcriptional activator